MAQHPPAGPRLLASAALVLALLAAACSTGPSGDARAPAGPTAASSSSSVATTATTSAPSPADPDPDPPAASYRRRPCPFEEPAGATSTCGALRVPLDRADPGAGSVVVAVARIRTPSASTTLPPILYFEGGPGGASLLWAEHWAGHRLARHREIILFDQRGTGWSTPSLACDAEFDDAPAAEPDEATYRRCRRRLDARTDPEAFTTRAAAQDVVDLLTALKLPTVDLVGSSYGTRLALVVADLAPGRIRSMVLDSVYPPGVEAFDLQGPNGQDAFQALFDLCAATPACDEAYPDLGGTMARAVRRLDDDWVLVRWPDGEGGTFPAPADGTDLVDAVFAALYDRMLVGGIPYALHLAADGDHEDVQLAFDVLAGEAEPGRRWPAPRWRASGRTAGNPPESSDGLYLSVTCSEELPLTSPEEIDEAGAGLDPAWRDGLLAGVRGELAVCGVWDPDGSSGERLGPVHSDVPALLLAGTLDPITPPAWAHQAAATLSRSTVAVLPAVGHGVMDSHLCAMDLVLDFLASPTAPVDDACVATVIPPPFALPD